MKLFDLTGKKAMVTGATRGLGRGMAEGLMEAGAEVVIFGTSDKAMEVAKEYCEKGYKCHGVKADLHNSDERKAAFKEALAYLGGDLDILVNAAGGINRYPNGEYTVEKYAELMKLNAEAPYELTLLAGEVMLKKGYGKIINVASLLSTFGGLHVMDYSASKGAICQMTKAFCNEWAAKGINVNAIAPGYMVTDLNAALLANPERMKELNLRIPTERWGTGADMKGAAVFLASAASDYVNGVLLPVDGGYTAR